ncbi:S-layer homology domain-containing protein [Paenibacillus eucommiae]|uniref:SLH domain-containing protein n=1 Tax=Paenibacillus eucommiae TaxID=1355755 RepID=A0ABS4IYJ1_9BACL|nr:S-layer homology domain-containing protein [Paenibacillus eucommiae]MBP1992625.1 hypothetical protein [Paenibacillus eucommiae]
MKKLINYLMVAALVFTILPLKPAQAAAANFFIPDNVAISNTANMITVDPALHTPLLTRSTAFLSNAKIMSISGIHQQVTSTSLNVTIEQITFNETSRAWQVEPGKTESLPVASTGGNRFNANGIELFPGFNRLTFTGSQGSVTKKDVFYVLYDSAPLLNTLQLISNSESFSLNEGASLVLTTPAASIQGNAANATSVIVNGQRASVLSNGMFFAPAVTLTPGLNNFNITLSNESDSITLKRQVYYYAPQTPITMLKVKQTGSTTQESLLSSIPTLTGSGSTAELELQFLVPYQNVPFNNANSQIRINSVVVPIASPGGVESVKETVISNTYGAPAFKLITLTTDSYDLVMDGADLAASQPVAIAVTYMPLTPTAVTFSSNYSFNLAVGQTLIKGISLLPGYVAGSNVTATTPTSALNGSEVSLPDFFIMVDTSVDLVTPADLKVALLPLSTSPLTITPLADTTPSSTKKVFKVSGLPEGEHTLSFTIGNTNPVPFLAKVNYVSKNYVSLEGLYNGLVLKMDSSKTTNMVQLKGKIIGFGSNLLNAQLLINNVDYSAAPHNLLNLSPQNLTDGSYDFPNVANANNISVDRNSGPLFFGENTIKFVVDYNAVPVTPGGPTSVLRQYVKEIKFYIVDTNVPTLSDVRPLTPPPASIVRGNLNSTDPSTYLPASPEFQNKQTYYATTHSNMDLFIEGSGASQVVVKDGGKEIYNAMISSNAVPQTTPTSVAIGSSAADFYGNQSAFRIRILNVPLSSVGTRVFTVELTNINGAQVTQTLEIHRDNVPYRLLAPAANTGSKIVVNKNFVLFDIEAQGATDVLINGKSAKPRADFSGRYTYTLIGLKADAENKVNLVVKRPGGEIKDTVIVNYVTDPDVGTMYMEAMGAKHSVFNKQVQLNFPKNTILRRVFDGRIQPQANLLFGIADPNSGNTELVNDYGQVLGIDLDGRTPNGSSPIPINAQLSSQFSNQFGREHFNAISPFYWISAGMGEMPSQFPYSPATGGIAPYSTDGTFTLYNQARVVVPSERGELKLSFNEAVVSQAGPEITVFFLGNDGIWKNLGGVVDVKARTITVPFDSFGFYMVGKLKYGFDDITNHGWARDILQALYSKGYMPNLYFNTFGSDDYITRGEFASLIVRSLGIKINSDNKNTFIDIIPGSRSTTWEYAEIETAARAGIIQGFENQVFAPDLLITRQDASVMITRALSDKLKQAINDDKLAAKLQKTFVDAQDISFYSRTAVEALSSAGIILGSPITATTPTKGKPLVNFNPKSDMTRAEAGQITVRILQKYFKTFPKNLT